MINSRFRYPSIRKCHALRSPNARPPPKAEEWMELHRYRYSVGGKDSLVWSQKEGKVDASIRFSTKKHNTNNSPINAITTYLARN